MGRSLSNQVIVRDSHVSRHHCELRLITLEGREPSWEILGQGKNGTFLNGELITQAELLDEATIQLAPKGPVLKIYLRDRIPDRDELLFSSLSKDAQRALLQRESLKRKPAEEAEAGGRSPR
ncbi:MAG: FHA domain-containing protein [Synechococcales cyanobacterium CRU_2_2]|nr:FHA domain-containing protein [Synechococcales cyanobacterium CRU_2_2]